MNRTPVGLTNSHDALVRMNAHDNLTDLTDLVNRGPERSLEVRPDYDNALDISYFHEKLLRLFNKL